MSSLLMLKLSFFLSLINNLSKRIEFVEIPRSAINSLFSCTRVKLRWWVETKRFQECNPRKLTSVHSPTGPIISTIACRISTSLLDWIRHEHKYNQSYTHIHIHNTRSYIQIQTRVSMWTHVAVSSTNEDTHVPVSNTRECKLQPRHKRAVLQKRWRKVKIWCVYPRKDVLGDKEKEREEGVLHPPFPRWNMERVALSVDSLDTPSPSANP